MPNLSTFRLPSNPILFQIYISCHPLSYASVYNCVLFRISGDNLTSVFFPRSLRCVSHQPEQPHFITIFGNGYNSWSSWTHIFSLCRLLFQITQHFLANVYSNTNNVREIWSSHGGDHEDKFYFKKYRLVAFFVCPNIFEESLVSMFGVEETSTLEMD